MGKVGEAEGAGRTDGGNRVTVLAISWALRRPELAAGYRRVTGDDRTEAYLTSRVLTLPEAQELARLGWTPDDLRQLVRIERPRALMPHPQPVDDRRPDPHSRARRWSPPAARPDLPRRADLPFGLLLTWARLRPQDRGWLAGITADELRRLAGPGTMDVLTPYLTCDLPIDPDTALLQARRNVPVTLFATVVRARGGTEGMDQEWIDTVLSGRWIHQVPEWETAGWISHPGQAGDLFSARTPDRTDPSTRWERWHPVARIAGPDGLHPATWWAAGFSPQEALRAFERGRVPDRSTLEAIAVVRGTTPAPDRAVPHTGPTG